MIFRNPLKTGVTLRYLFTFTLFGCVWIVIEYFLFEKEAFNGYKIIFDAILGVLLISQPYTVFTLVILIEILTLINRYRQI